MAKTKFTIYAADCRGKAANCKYAHAITVTDAETMRQAVSRDHVCAEYRNAYRSEGNFVSTDCLPMDCDNDHSDNPSDWKKPADVAAAFPGVAFAVSYSRNHMKEKDGKAARPKFHCYFPIAPITDAKRYVALKQAAYTAFPYFDKMALDAARFFFGTETPDVAIYDGETTLNAVLPMQETICEGKRNSTLSHSAGKILKRYGDGEQAKAAFMQQADKCEPPLATAELATIYKSAQGFYHNKIETAPGYVPPEQYKQEFALQPAHNTEVDEARVLADNYSGVLRHSVGTGYIVYDGMVWHESEARAHGCLHDLTERQLNEIAPVLISAQAAAAQAQGAYAMATDNGGKGEKESAKQAYADAQGALKYLQAYKAFLLKCRDSKKIGGVLVEARTPLEIDVSELDKNGYSLNTPGGEVSLSDGQINPHLSESYHTKITAVAPSDEGADIWRDFLHVISCGDLELESYLQLIAGQTIIGKVLCENIVIAYGSGRNGKSTFFNTQLRVLGDYAGQISAETLTTGRKNGKNWELAELRGKRLIIAPELEEGTRLDAAFVKKICSTETILAEQKYKSPFNFAPSHTTVLYTNHLPRVGSTDAGTWRRLIVIPFNAVIEGQADIKNYADYLYRHAGGAVLAWMVEGAQRFIKADYRIEPPACVKAAIAAYRAANDWLSNFIADCCELSASYVQKSGELYAEYRNYCERTGEYTRSAQDFKAAIEGAGYTSKRTAQGVMFIGLRVICEFMREKGA